MGQLSTTGLIEHLLRIEKEVGELRRALLKLHGTESAQKNPGSLRGMWRDVVLDDQDFTEAKASLFPGKDGCLS
ncbi:MAG: hypothetical protein V3R80_05010 [Candidatus Tectomicrobia bacterium]